MTAAGLEQSGQREEISPWLAGPGTLQSLGIATEEKPLSLLGRREAGGSFIPQDLFSATCTPPSDRKLSLYSTQV